MKGTKKRMVAVLLVSALVLTSVPNVAELTAYAAENTWKVLSEKDIVFDDIYDLEDNVLIGRKSGKITTLDNKLEQIDQGEYDQIETRAKDGYLLSKKNGNETGYAVLDTLTGKISPFVTGNYDSIEPFYCGNDKYCYKVKKGMKYGILNWETGEKEISVNYTKIARLYDDSETGTIFAEKEDGTNGFICNGKELGFDNSITKNDGCLYGTSIVVGSDIYYVKEYFENEDVFDDLYHITSSTNLSSLKKDIEEHLADEKCKLVFYSREGGILKADSILQKLQEATSESDAIMTTVKEKSKNDAVEYCTNEYSAEGTNIENVSLQKYGSVYVVCVVAGWTDDQEEYSTDLLGVYNESGERLLFGRSLIRYDIGDVEDEGWDEDILIRNDRDEICYCDDSGTVKQIYTDREGVFRNVSEKTSVYDDSIVIYGQKNRVMVANPHNGYVKIGCKVFGDSYDGIKSDVFARGLLVNDSEERNLILYDYDYNEVKKIDLSDMGEQLQATESACVITVKDDNGILIVDTEAKTKKISLTDYPDFSKVKDFYKILDEVYAYTKNNGRHALYRVSDQTKLMEKSDASMWIDGCYRIDGVNVVIYGVDVDDEDTTYYGLMDTNGNIMADAKLLKYTEYSVISSSYEDEKKGIREYIEFRDGEENHVYYYGEDMSAHEKEKDDEDSSDDNGISYGDVKYYRNYLQDGGREEKVCDSKGTVLVSYKKTEQELEKEGYRQNVYMFPECQSILLVKKHWDGKRDAGETGENPTPTPTATPVNDPTPTPTQTVAPANDPTPVSAGDSVLTSPSVPDNKSNAEIVKEGKKGSKIELTKGRIIKIKNVKGKKIKVTIKKVKKATGYQIFYAVDSKFKKKKVLSSKGTSVTLKKLKKKVYYVKVRAYAKSGKKKIYGSWSKKKKIRVKK